MQTIQPKRSKFKKSTVNYNQDNILDIIDIEETLSKNRFIEKVPLSDFIFYQCTIPISSLNHPQKRKGAL